MDIVLVGLYLNRVIIPHRFYYILKCQLKSDDGISYSAVFVRGRHFIFYEGKDYERKKRTSVYKRVRGIFVKLTDRGFA